MKPAKDRLLQLCFLAIWMVTLSSCQQHSKFVSETYSSFHFDQRVIDKLPDYDSLANAIVAVMPLFQKSINVKESYRSYRYRPDSSDTESFHTLPEGAGESITRLYNKIGKEFIEGFDVFTDSTIKISIRSTNSTTVPVVVDEALSYYPAAKGIQKRTFPIRDTLLNKHWQYWARIREMSYF